MGGSASTSSPSPAPSGSAPAKKEEFGILNFFIEDEEKRKELREKAEKMSEAAKLQPLQTVAPAPINVNGGLLQQPGIIPMGPAGGGIYGMDPTKMEGGLEKFMNLVGTFF